MFRLEFCLFKLKFLFLSMELSFPPNTPEVKVLFPGYSKLSNNVMLANCSCTLIKGPPHCIVDTMTAWDSLKIVEALKLSNLTPDDISYVICTHGHSDHIGSNHLFTKALHIVGFSISQGEKYFLKPNFSEGEEYAIGKWIKVVPTPGHTLQDVSVIVNTGRDIYAITGDLFEKEEDIKDESIWISAGSDNLSLQRENRNKIMKLADYIIPGHGPMFKVTNTYQKVLT